MKLRLYWKDNAWFVTFIELGYSIPLPFLDHYHALESLQRLFPDSDIVVDRHELRPQCEDEELHCGPKPKKPELKIVK